MVTRQPGRQLVDQPRRLGEQGRRVVARRAASTGSPTTPRRSCTGGSSPTGQHLELGIAETNLVGLLGELGATWSRWGQPLLPIGVLYDPFVERALEPWSFGIYAGGQSILVGTPSGVTLAPEGGAHQSITTPSIGLEQPGCITYEPAFAIDVEWTLLAVARPAGPPGRHLGLPAAVDPAGRPGAGRRARPTRPPASGAAARSSPAPTRCAVRRRRPRSPSPRWARSCPRRWPPRTGSPTLGHAADVVCVTSPGLLFDAVQARGAARGDGRDLDPRRRSSPPGGPRRWSPCSTGTRTRWRSSPGVHRVPAAHLGVTRFGQSGDLEAVYRYHGLDTDSVVAAALDLSVDADGATT